MLIQFNTLQRKKEIHQKVNIFLLYWVELSQLSQVSSRVGNSTEGMGMRVEERTAFL